MYDFGWRFMKLKYLADISLNSGETQANDVDEVDGPNGNF